MDREIKNTHEPSFSRSLSISSRNQKIVVPNAHTHIRSVFSSVIEKSKEADEAPISRKPQSSRNTNNSPVPNHMIHLDEMRKAPVIVSAKSLAPQPKKIAHPFNDVAAKKPMQHVVAVPKVIPAPQKHADLASALSNIENTSVAFNPFAPNAIEPGAKMAAKKSKFAKTKTAVKTLAKSKRESALKKKISASKEQIAKNKILKAEQKAKNREVRENLLTENGALSDSLANNLLVAAAETRRSPEPESRNSLQAGSGVIAESMVSNQNLLNKFANVKITFAMPHVDAHKVLSVLRVIAIALVLAVSAYLVWDTWVTNRDIQSNITSAASAMSIASTDPTTADPTAVSSQQYAAYTTPADEPRYIQISSIGVNARVMKVGVTSNGNIDTPSKLADTAWYDGSAKPGQAGEVFIDGQTSFSNSTAASFNNLPNIKIGDQIAVQTGNGNNYTYKVVSAGAVPTAKVSMEKALNTPGDAAKGLTLMTCAGKYNYQIHNATERYVVYAVQE